MAETNKQKVDKSDAKAEQEARTPPELQQQEVENADDWRNAILSQIEAVALGSSMSTARSTVDQLYLRLKREGKANPQEWRDFTKRLMQVAEAMNEEVGTVTSLNG